MLASPQYGIIGLCHLLLGQTDQAIDLIARARANNPRFYYVHLWLAGALGFKGDLEPARAALAQAIKIDPRITSFAAQRADAPYIAYAPHWALREKTLNLGLRRIGHPEE